MTTKRNWRGSVIEGPTEEAIDEMIAEVEASEARRRRWPADTREAMAVLAELFPSLRGVPGTSPWDVDQLIGWLNGPAPGSGACWAGRFCLSVWNPGTNWNDHGLKGPGRFDLHEAMGVWDRQHIAAMQRWIEAPFWP